MIIDNQSGYIKDFEKKFLAEQAFDYIFFDHNQPVTLPRKAEIKGIILSGGKGNPYTPLNLTTNFVALMNWDVPILGFCLGHEILAVAYGCQIRKLAKYQNKKENITITKPEDPIFEDLNTTKVKLQKKHSFHVSHLSKDFEVLGESKICPHEIIKHKEKSIYGFQSHPEVLSEEGLLIVKNFLKICNLL